MSLVPRYYSHLSSALRAVRSAGEDDYIVDLRGTQDATERGHAWMVCDEYLTVRRALIHAWGIAPEAAAEIVPREHPPGGPHVLRRPRGGRP